MTKILDSIDGVAERYPALLCDLWGCYHDGIRPHPEAVAALRRHRARGGIVLLLTNAPRPAASVRSFLDAMGAPADSYDGIMSSGEACLRVLADGSAGTRFFYLGPERDLHVLTEAGRAPVELAQADAVLCTGLVDDSRETPEDYAGLLAEIRARGLPMLCANPDIVVDRGAERLWCAGALARDYAGLGGRVMWFGKPHVPTYDQSFARLAELAGRPMARAEVLAIGDGIATDIRGAAQYGLEAVFVTGGLAAAELGQDPEHPDPDRLAAWLAAAGEAPAYAIGRLR